ncbi:HU family DNA-binding protein [Microbacterium sp. NC79]|uniref:HU family DNA-binding protein n=1 Tax=Microbacterium sp. NC79 TaxID=2851009 RepID=UPI001C2B8D15|nr:HU family DNA-binding protein [Microbacterium sp. NC79]MBV0894663.1 HU family DNA-binding protein [Microbacterium sp. NC79]
MNGLGGARVSKREFIKRVARRAGVPTRVAALVYEATVEEILDTVSDGKRLTLTGFGKFFLQRHKGHRVTTIGDRAEGATDLGEIADYSVLKFSATRAVNKDVGYRLSRRTERIATDTEQRTAPTGPHPHAAP